MMKKFLLGTFFTAMILFPNAAFPIENGPTTPWVPFGQQVITNERHDAVDGLLRKMIGHDGMVLY